MQAHSKPHSFIYYTFIHFRLEMKESRTTSQKFRLASTRLWEVCLEVPSCMSSVALSIPSLLSAPQKWAKCEKFREILKSFACNWASLPLFLGTEISPLPNIGGADQQFREVWNLGPKTETEVFEAPFRVCPHVKPPGCVRKFYAYSLDLSWSLLLFRDVPILFRFCFRFIGKSVLG